MGNKEKEYYEVSYNNLTPKAIEELFEVEIVKSAEKYAELYIEFVDTNFEEVSAKKQRKNKASTEEIKNKKKAKDFLVEHADELNLKITDVPETKDSDTRESTNIADRMRKKQKLLREQMEKAKKAAQEDKQ